MGLQLHQTAGLPGGVRLLPQLVDRPVDLAYALVAVHHLHLHDHPGAGPVKDAAAPGIAHDRGIIGDAEVVGDQVVVLDGPAGETDLLGQDPVHVRLLLERGRLPLVKVLGILIL